MPYVLENMNHIDLTESEARMLVAMNLIVETGEEYPDCYSTTALLWDDFALDSEDQLLLIESVLIGLRKEVNS